MAAIYQVSKLFDFPLIYHLIDGLLVSVLITVSHCSNSNVLLQEKYGLNLLTGLLPVGPTFQWLQLNRCCGSTKIH